MANSEGSFLHLNLNDAKAAIGLKKDAILSAAQAVKDHTKQATEQSKVYLEQLTDKVGTLAQKATDKATVKYDGLQTTAQTQIQGVKENYDKARKAGQTSGTSSDATSTDRSITPGNSGNDAIKFPYNVVTWCTSVCGGKDGHGPTIAGRDFNIESLQASGQNLASDLQSKASTAAQQAETAAADAQKVLADKAAAGQDAAASEEKKLVEQAEAAKDAAVAAADGGAPASS